MPTFLDFFFDPLLRASTLGSMLVCMISGLVGVIVFIRKRSLLSEALSHSAYPGIVIAGLFAAVFFKYSETGLSAAFFIGAFLFSLLSLFLIEKFEEIFRERNDAILCFILAGFLGFGVLLASRVQFTHGLIYQKIQVFLYGQAATLTEDTLVFYVGLAVVVFLFLVLFSKEIKTIAFDGDFAKSVGINIRFVKGLIHVALALTIVMGIRSVGVILMSGMLFIPATTARQYTDRLSVLFVLSGCFGLLSAFLGVFLSVMVPLNFAPSLALPTGPLITLTAGSMCILSVLFAPKRGMVPRFIRILIFQKRCQRENLLKALWKKQGSLSLIPSLALYNLRKKGFVKRADNREFQLTEQGKKKAARIVRLHRLWELYLASQLGTGVKRVHKNAEEMEHIITPELEKRLDELLKNPTHDPHNQPIPQKEGV